MERGRQISTRDRLFNFFEKGYKSERTANFCSCRKLRLTQLQEEQRYAKEAVASLSSKAQDADDYLIYSTLESDLATLRKYFGWKFVPLVFFGGFGLKSMAGGAGALLNLITHAIASRVAKLVPFMGQDRLATLSGLVLASWFAKHVTESQSWEVSYLYLLVMV
jgi:hypothetical protein